MLYICTIILLLLSTITDDISLSLFNRLYSWSIALIFWEKKVVWLYVAPCGTISVNTVNNNVTWFYTWVYVPLNLFTLQPIVSYDFMFLPVRSTPVYLHLKRYWRKLYVSICLLTPSANVVWLYILSNLVILASFAQKQIKVG